MPVTVPTMEDVRAAAEVLRGHAVHTPLLKSKALDKQTGADVYVKPENFQHTGSFKFRGAYNAIARLSVEELSAGVVASSSGNHAQGIAEAARMFGTPATIVMPHDAPQMKVERTRASGADVLFYNRETGDREKTATDFLEEHGGVFIHPFEHVDVIAGQGTVGLEVCEDLKAAGKKIDRVLVCTGGGGLTAGVALTVTDYFPNAIVHSVEPEGFDDYSRSLVSGTREKNARNSGSICDAIISPMPGEIGFEINHKLLAEGIVISDDEALSAMRFAYQELKIVAEPGGAAALAGLLQAGKKWQDETIVVTVSGGNVDPEMFSRAINTA